MFWWQTWHHVDVVHWNIINVVVLEVLLKETCNNFISNALLYVGDLNVIFTKCSYFPIFTLVLSTRFVFIEENLNGGLPCKNCKYNLYYVVVEWSWSLYAMWILYIIICTLYIYVNKKLSLNGLLQCILKVFHVYLFVLQDCWYCTISLYLSWCVMEVLLVCNYSQSKYLDDRIYQLLNQKCEEKSLTNNLAWYEPEKVYAQYEWLVNYNAIISWLFFTNFQIINASH